MANLPEDGRRGVCGARTGHLSPTGAHGDHVSPHRHAHRLPATRDPALGSHGEEVGGMGGKACLYVEEVGEEMTLFSSAVSLLLSGGGGAFSEWWHVWRPCGR